MKMEQLIFDATRCLPTGIRLEYDLAPHVLSSVGSATLFAPHDESINFTLEVKHIHRMDTLKRVQAHIESLQRERPVLLICNQLTQSLAAYCMQNDINFIDTAGNASIQLPGFFMLIEGKQEKKSVTSGGRFPVGVMKLLFILLSDPSVIDQPYRALAEMAGISLGMVSKAFEYLEHQRYFRKTKNGRRLIGVDELCAMWIDDYPRSLKPKLDQLKLAMPEKPEHLALTDDEIAGGELAAANLSNGYLVPASAIVYTPHPLLQRRKELALKPSSEGDFQLIAGFWGNYHLTSRARAMLCLADLLDSGDDRRREVARIINEKYLNLNEATLFSY
ncbi:type IV toxin-antitoxin system AbiEi family antitoxin (plasmid) [Pantoea sp. BRR-3P]|uniref:type IV toxin-antitoxin system AbiEi family antitoxin n=1 Tax=Pantoea sp. BRR-3P TaxID=3141541 RepID=UPI0031F5D398